MGTKNTLSLGCKNRIHVWMQLLEKTCSYLIVWEKIWNNISNVPYEFDCLYCTSKEQRRFRSEYIIEQSLLESAVIAFCNVFTAGKAGTGVADNYDNDIISTRRNMLDYASKNLGYPNANDFDSFINKVKAVRHQLLAHYDGSKADYHLPDLDLIDNEGNRNGNFTQNPLQPIIQMQKLPVVDLEFDEKKKLREVSLYMLEYLDILLLDN